MVKSKEDELAAVQNEVDLLKVCPSGFPFSFQVNV
jgi:hypothetical protein